MMPGEISPAHGETIVVPVPEAFEIEWAPAPYSTQWEQGTMALEVEMVNGFTLRLYAHKDALRLVEPALAAIVRSGALTSTRRIDQFLKDKAARGF